MWEKIFFDSDGVFMWSSTAAIVALIGSVISGIFSWLGYVNAKKNAESQQKIEQKKIDADLKAKARIEWITQVRIEAADFITNCLLYVQYSPQTVIGKPTNVKASEITSTTATITFDSEPDQSIPSDFDEIVNDREKEKIRVQLNNSANRLMIYFGPDKDGENDKIVLSIEKILSRVNKGNFYQNDESNNDQVTEFREDIRQYLKKEWDRAKEGK
ncbi:hypothetical protein [Enterococcus gallinarum]|uniref:hypothetical protein n=1 Tax=Enterococcus gallinarum TaxID=1353 RepID=UPI0027DF3AB9|nr:hypothetical protein [Enterococcus gallinarum]MDQ6112794.1 hypothetical protein [Enterococcus gallinarum]